MPNVQRARSSDYKVKISIELIWWWECFLELFACVYFKHEHTSTRYAHFIRFPIKCILVVPVAVRYAIVVANHRPMLRIRFVSLGVVAL